MAPKTRAPTTASLPDSLRIPSTTRSLIKSFSRLSRAGIVKLALEWLEPRNQPLCAPYLSINRSQEEETEEDYAYQPSDSVEELREIYKQLLEAKSTKRDVIDRILEGDWRRGISLHQLAMLDFSCLEENQTCSRWTALKLVENRVKNGKEIEEDLVAKKNTKAVFPTIRVSTFVRNLQKEIAPLVKAHYHVHQLHSHTLTVLRLFISDSPYSHAPLSTQRTFTDSARTIFIAFPNSCPFLYISVSGTQMGGSENDQAKRPAMVDIASLKRMVLEAVPKALSRPQQRINLQTTSLTAKSLSTMISLRGHGRSNAANGAFSIFADGVVEQTPLSVIKRMQMKDGAQLDHVPAESSIEIRSLPQVPSPSSKKRRSPLRTRNVNSFQQIDQDDNEMKKAKKRKIDAQLRFGTTGLGSLASTEKGHDTTNSDCSKAPIDRVAVKLIEPLSLSHTATPRSSSLTTNESEPIQINVTFHGTDIFAGLRLLVEQGLIDAETMPSWMTGEDCVSSGVVRNGKLVDGKGGGA
ncbi:putative chl4 family chromosome segregation [Phaeomoniella chlamydospora]|uniref:Putative chl4 family chromosome segregation n=1 Tax=Phaeomoniella chlamydospora TaxID=158046 RepID=A0A0G2F2V3_PHACM|nr:putative chl4 family chromosome segregation [Phaeomoniella chlamydospora]